MENNQAAFKSDHYVGLDLGPGHHHSSDIKIPLGSPANFVWVLNNPLLPHLLASVANRII